MAILYSEVENSRVLEVFNEVGDYTSFLGVGVKSGGATNQKTGQIHAGQSMREDEIIQVKIMPVTRGGDGDLLPTIKPVVGGDWAPVKIGHRTRLIRNTSATIDADFEIVLRTTSDHDNEESWPIEATTADDHGLPAFEFLSHLNFGSGFVGVRMASESIGGFDYAVEISVISNVNL